MKTAQPGKAFCSGHSGSTPISQTMGKDWLSQLIEIAEQYQDEDRSWNFRKSNGYIWYFHESEKADLWCTMTPLGREIYDIVRKRKHPFLSTKEMQSSENYCNKITKRILYYFASCSDTQKDCTSSIIQHSPLDDKNEDEADNEDPLYIEDYKVIEQLMKKYKNVHQLKLMAIETLSQEFKLHLMPLKEQAPEVFEKLVRWIQTDRIPGIVHVIKIIEKYPDTKQAKDQKLPIIVLYVQGFDNAEHILQYLLENLEQYKGARLYTPRHNKAFSDLIFAAGGDGDMKANIVAKSLTNRRIFTDDMTFFNTEKKFW